MKTKIELISSLITELCMKREEIGRYKVKLESLEKVSSTMPTGIPEPTYVNPELVRAALNSRDVIGQIKAIRQMTGLGLKDAKDLLETVLHSGNSPL